MLVSAIIPTFNRSDMVGLAIVSVLNQTYPSLEIIVVDDGSTDNTAEVVRGYASKYPGRIRYAQKANGGCASARNMGVELATGELIAFLDSDDQWFPNAIEHLVGVLKASGAVFVYSPYIDVLPSGQECVSYPAAAGDPARFPLAHFLTNQAGSCSILYRRCVFDKLRLDESLRHNEDSDFLQRVALHFDAAYAPHPTARVFHHESNKSKNRVSIYRALLASSEAVLRDFPEFARTLGELGDRRIVDIKLKLVEELVKDNRFQEAQTYATTLGARLRFALRYSVCLKSPLPLRAEGSIVKVTSTLHNIANLACLKKPACLKVMHVFHAYLHMTENWGYRLIKNLPDSRLYIVSEESLNEETFHIDNAVFLLKPSLNWKFAPHPLLQKAADLSGRLLALIWHKLVLFSARRADVIHCHFSFMGWNYLWLSQKTGTPLAISFYGFDYERLPNEEPVWRERYRELFDKADLFIAEGSFGREKLVQMGCPASKAKVVHLGVELPRIPYYKRNKNPNELSLVQVATFVTKKGYDVTIKAFVKAVEKCPNMTLTLVGKDPEGVRGGLQRLVRDYGLDDKVRFIDGIDFSRLHLFLKDFQVFIHPSKYGHQMDSEGGAPIVLLDAQASGMPVLSTLHCDIPEEVVHGETGMLVVQNDTDALAEAIGAFYRMEEPVYQAYGERARRHVERNYDAEQCARDLKKMYEETLGTVKVRR